MANEQQPLLQVRQLKKYFDKSSGLFSKKKKVLTAVDGITFDIYKGETFGLVGESGCGKSTTGRTIIGLYDATDGEIIFDGEVISAGVELLKEKRREIKKDKELDKETKREKLDQLEQDIAARREASVFPLELRKKIQMIFQDPYASLNGRMTVTDIIAEGITTHKIYDEEPNRDELIQERVFELLESVGLKREHASRYPHEFSGGQRQRIGIARALAVEPELIICDEPISALDVSIQAQVVNMLEDFQKDKDLTYLFIAHDLSMVKHISDRIGVMYLGTMMEIAESEELYQSPLHPYTKALLSSIPVPDPENENKGKRIILKGDVPSPINPKPGCRFAKRCRYAVDTINIDTKELFFKEVIGRNAFEHLNDPEDNTLLIAQGEEITEELAEMLYELGINSFNVIKEKCNNVTPLLEEPIKGHFTACHFIKEINNIK